LSESDYDTGAFMTANQRKLVVDWPVTKHGVQVGVADSGEQDVDEGLSLLQVGSDPLLFDRDGASFLAERGHHLLVWNLEVSFSRVDLAGSGRHSGVAVVGVV
jgi:hypothetical protein